MKCRLVTGWEGKDLTKYLKILLIQKNLQKYLVRVLYKVVAPPRLELGHPCERRILNPLRLPFRQEATNRETILRMF